jgi:hypothetical protein
MDGAWIDGARMDGAWMDVMPNEAQVGGAENFAIPAAN